MVMLAAIALISACSSTAGAPNQTGGSPGGAASVHRPGFCPAGLLGLRIERLPANFDAVAAYECQEAIVTVAGRGQWSVENERKASDGLSSLSSALSRPDQKPPAGSFACPTDFVSGPLFALVAGNGRLIRPRIPVGECQQPQLAVLAAVAALPWVIVHHRLLHQVETPAELESGCPTAFKDLFDLYALSLERSPAGPSLNAHVASITVCAYRDTKSAINHPDGRIVPGADVPVGAFVGWGRFSGPAEMNLLRGLRSGRRTAGCASQHPRFAIIMPTGGQFNTVVELGGCDRVLRISLVPGRQPLTNREVDKIGQATPQAVALIERVAS